MGDIADMVLEGILDMHTGEYIGEPCGYPRTFEAEEIKKSSFDHKCLICGKELTGKNSYQQHLTKHLTNLNTREVEEIYKLVNKKLIEKGQSKKGDKNG